MNSPLRVLMIPAFYPPNGGEFTIEQAKALVRAGVKVDIIANVMVTLTENKLKYFTYPYCVTTFNYEGVRVMQSYQRRIPKVLFYHNIDKWISNTVKLYERYVDKFGRPDIIHVQASMWAGAAAAEIKRKHSIPYIITEHLSFDILRDIQCRYSKSEEYIKRAYYSTDYLITVSRELYDDGQEWINPQIPFRVISNILDKKFTSLIPTIKKKSNQPFTFVALNRYWFYKGYDVLLEAVDILSERFDKFQVLIAGSGFECDEFQSMFCRIRNRDKVLLLGEVGRDKVIELLTKSDALALPSRAEAQSRTILESLALGTPALGTDIIPKVLLNSDTGIMVPRNNPQAFADGMLYMIENINKFDREKIRSIAHNMAEESVVVKSIIEVYQEVLKRDE